MILAQHVQSKRKNTMIIVGLYFFAASNYVLFPPIIYLMQLLFLGPEKATHAFGLHIEYYIKKKSNNNFQISCFFLIFFSFYGYDYRNDVIKYWILVLPINILFLTLAIVFGSVNFLIASLIDYVTYYFKFVQTELRQLEKELDLKDIEYEMNLKKIIQHHDQALR